MGIAIEILTAELDREREKLSALRSDRADVIRAGLLAQDEVNRQERHVDEIATAISTLTDAEKQDSMEVG